MVSGHFADESIEFCAGHVVPSASLEHKINEQ